MGGVSGLEIQAARTFLTRIEQLLLRRALSSVALCHTAYQKGMRYLLLSLELDDLVEELICGRDRFSVGLETSLILDQVHELRGQVHC